MMANWLSWPLLLDEELSGTKRIGFWKLSGYHSPPRCVREWKTTTWCGAEESACDLLTNTNPIEPGQQLPEVFLCGHRNALESQCFAPPLRLTA